MSFIHTLIVIGTLLLVLAPNSLVSIFLIRRYRRTRHPINLLYANLCLTCALIILGVFANQWSVIVTVSSSALWLKHLTCRSLAFFEMFITALASYTVVGVVADAALRLRQGREMESHIRTKRLIYGAWAVAAVVSLSEAVIWEMRDMNGSTKTGTNSTRGYCDSIWIGYFRNSDTRSSFTLNTVYLFYVMLVTFWAPFAAALAGGVMIIKSVLKKKQLVVQEVNDDDESALFQAREGDAETGGSGVYLHTVSKPTDKTAESGWRTALALIVTFIITALPYNVLLWKMVHMVAPSSSPEADRERVYEEYEYTLGDTFHYSHIVLKPIAVTLLVPLVIAWGHFHLCCCCCFRRSNEMKSAVKMTMPITVVNPTDDR